MSAAARQAQQVVRLIAVRFGLQVFLSVAARDDYPDGFAIGRGPETPSPVLDALDGHIELNAPGSPGILRTLGPANAVDPAVGIGADPSGWNAA